MKIFPCNGGGRSPEKRRFIFRSWLWTDPHSGYSKETGAHSTAALFSGAESGRANIDILRGDRFAGPVFDAQDAAAKQAEFSPKRGWRPIRHSSINRSSQYGFVTSWQKWSECFPVKEANHETGDNHCRHSPCSHFHCPLLRIIFQVNIIANGVSIPVWLSILGCFVPPVLALMLWRENKK